MRMILSFAVSTCSGEPLNFNCVPRESIFSNGNFFLRISNLPLFTPKNSIGLTVSRLMIVSVKDVCLVYKFTIFVGAFSYPTSLIQFTKLPIDFP